MTYLLVTIAALLIVFGYLADRQKRKRDEAALSELVKYQHSEDYVIKRQIEFEAWLAESARIRLPDAIRGRELYIYRELMRGWFEKLIAKNRYNETLSEKIRTDWLTYMNLLESRATHHFLGLETDDGSKKEKFMQEAHEESAKIASIENGYAEEIGPEAVETLRQVRERPFDNFSHSSELAP